jgi:hypothetical protein
MDTKTKTPSEPQAKANPLLFNNPLAGSFVRPYPDALLWRCFQTFKGVNTDCPVCRKPTRMHASSERELNFFRDLLVLTPLSILHGCQRKAGSFRGYGCFSALPVA